MINALYITAGVGVLLSFYTLYVEYKLKKNQSYQALCDLDGKSMSCTRTFKSSYGKMAGISNAWPGIFYYLSVIGLTFYDRMDLVFYLTALGILASAYLAYILYFKLKNFCMICNAIYLVNILLLVFSWLNP